ncbi:hypothetical protein [Micromonospora sp. NBC_01796]|uniref:hypothetical protein n=1 Tax=Micromonospora sp. NBC_01796 TaxID=2975987 RepID=UPI002DD96B55|nr:hypothetical protein [Micromonospora sp. NBC_01796]WSA87899.1 hypothetical protein OIE47_09990 [Micromonospora sp. NBC_01796]
MRYLTRSLALSALRRGKGVEQFLGAVDVADVPAIRWVSVDPWNAHYRVSMDTVQDPDDENFQNLSNLMPVDPTEEDYVGEGRELARVADEAEAIAYAESLAGAHPDRWVNFGMTGAEYADLVRSRRPHA